MSNCRVCGKDLPEGVMRCNDHILLQSRGVTNPICGECSEKRPDDHHLEFKRATANLNFADAFKPPIRRRGEVVIKNGTLDKLCDCKECDLRLDACCDKYRDRLKKAFPLGKPYDIEGRMVVPVMDGFVPKKLLDFYTGSIIERLKAVNRKRIIHPTETRRMLWDVEEMEDERRQMHIAILAAAGFTPFDVSKEGVAFKIVIEEYITDRARKMGVIA